ncbi:hypothetical protein RJT34_12074 [Clitoria ternatea]|uniref:Uncharacterized protein n=1 Tax=Clitoria ternatea TaxID=43366 RepID=A0AAN9JNS3_CLITE
MEKEKKEKKCAKSETAVRRCAKAALLLHRLKSIDTGHHENSQRQIQDLKIQLLKERFKLNKIKLCSFVELFLQLLLLLSESRWYVSMDLLSRVIRSQYAVRFLHAAVDFLF